MCEKRAPYVNRIYAVIVNCTICGCKVGKVNQGGDRVDIICMACSEEEEPKTFDLNIPPCLLVEEMDISPNGIKLDLHDSRDANKKYYTYLKESPGSRGERILRSFRSE